MNRTPARSPIPLLLFAQLQKCSNLKNSICLSFYVLIFGSHNSLAHHPPIRSSFRTLLIYFDSSHGDNRNKIKPVSTWRGGWRCSLDDLPPNATLPVTLD